MVFLLKNNIIFIFIVLLLFTGCNTNKNVTITNKEIYYQNFDKDIRPNPYSFEFGETEKNINDTYK